MVDAAFESTVDSGYFEIQENFHLSFQRDSGHNSGNNTAS